MLVILPDRKDGLSNLEKRLSTHVIDDCLTRMTSRDVELFHPRFKLTWGANLCEYLAPLGMTIPFDRSQADLSGINGYRPPHEEALFISAIYQKAFADVNEQGTEAAAATAMETQPTSGLYSKPSPVPVFRADHPFFFAIRDRKSGAFLFLGRVSDLSRDS